MEQPMNQDHQATAAEQAKAAPVVPARKPWPVEKPERRLLPISLGLAFLAVWVLLETFEQGRLIPGLGTTALVAGWYAALFLYRGTAGMERRVNRLLMAAVGLLALTFALFSNRWFRFWNSGALALLLAVHTWELCGGGSLPWDQAGMLLERLGLLIQGPFVRLGALADTLPTLNKRGKGRWLPALAGIALACPVLWLVTAVLMDADAVFALVAGDALAWLDQRFGVVLLRLILALCAMPFLFSLLYFAAHTQRKEREKKAKKEREALPWVILLGALDGLYLFFLAVQSAALFGNRSYLQRAGISFAEYARSGFFQLVGLAGLNAAVILLAVWLCREDRRLKLLATLLVALTAVLLVSAAWRMTLYVSAYGLSFKRCLTYWGMVMLAILLALTLLRVWKRDFPFFRWAAPIALAGWLALNYCNVDSVAARYNAARVEAGSLPQSAVSTLFHAGTGYDGLDILAELAGDQLAVEWRREGAARECGSWTTWSLSAYLAARG